MNNLPSDNNLPIEHLAGSFNNVTNSYKFFWFLAILEQVRMRNNPVIIPIDDLLASMSATVWYPARYFQLSFGKQDYLAPTVLKLDIPLDTTRQQIVTEVKKQLNLKSAIGKDIRERGRYVPYRFLVPFFAQQLRGKLGGTPEKRIAKIVNTAFTTGDTKPLYRFVKNSIEIHPDWLDYLQKQYHILSGFCLWHLLNYLQKNNPNVPNIAGKLFPPESRDMKLAKEFWQLVFKQWGTIDCVYSQQSMHGKKYSLDHFLPWRFVSHDHIWNLIPAPKPVNSSKSDALPDMDAYFDDFARLQYNAFQTVVEIGRPKLLEDYTILFKQADIANIKQLSYEQFRQELHNAIAPQMQVARNMGFVTNWTYSP